MDYERSGRAASPAGSNMEEEVMETYKMHQLFPLGEIVITPGVDEAFDKREVFHALIRHMTGDWSDLSERACERNEDAIEDDSEVISWYHSEDGTRMFCVTTTWDRSETIVRLPNEN